MFLLTVDKRSPPEAQDQVTQHYSICTCVLILMQFFDYGTESNAPIY